LIISAEFESQLMNKKEQSKIVILFFILNKIYFMNTIYKTVFKA